MFFGRTSSGSIIGKISRRKSEKIRGRDEQVKQSENSKKRVFETPFSDKSIFSLIFLEEPVSLRTSV